MDPRPRLATRKGKLRRVWSLLDRREHRAALLVLGLMLIVGAVETVGIGLVFPFLSIAAEPDLIHENGVLNAIYDGMGFASDKAFLIATGSGVLVMLVMMNALAALSVWAQMRLVWDIHDRLSARLLHAYLRRPYVFFTGRNSAEMGKNVLHEANNLVMGVFKPSVELVGQTILIAFILALLLVVEPLITLVMLTVVGGAYAIVYLRLRHRLQDLGQRSVAANNQRYQVVQEAFGAVKEIKAYGREEAFLARYRPSSRTYSRNNARHSVLDSLPRYLIQTITFGGLTAVLLFLLAKDRPLVSVVPVLGMFAFAGYRMMPAFQQILSAFTKFRYYDHLVAAIHADMTWEDEVPALLQGPTQVPFTRALRLHDVTYSYPGTSREVLKGISLTIPKNGSIAFIGATGAGKTTLIDILLGVLHPSGGTLSVDDMPLPTLDLPAWHAKVGYVPQNIFLLDDSVRRNIAFGVPDDEIDDVRVEEAARLANIHGFISSQLETGYDTFVGERGVRLSGGQRQRIGIARALYQDPEVLVLDEATSNIDTVTEAAITEAIRGLSGRMTLVVVAHRLETIRGCDRIYVLDSGRVVAEGDFDRLHADSPTFQALARTVTARA